MAEHCTRVHFLFINQHLYLDGQLGHDVEGLRAGVEDVVDDDLRLEPSLKTGECSLDKYLEPFKDFVI